MIRFALISFYKRRGDCIRVADLITDREIENWKAGDAITVTAGTGTGKSYFVKNNLYHVAEQRESLVLLLVHRKNCLAQFENEIKRDGKCKTIHIATYQKIQHEHLHQRITFDLSQYDYIVCDEFHYFLDDAAFNNATDLSFDAILQAQGTIKVFMSATGENMKAYLNSVISQPTIDYELPTDYSFIRSLNFFYNDQTMEVLANQWRCGQERAIFLIQSAKKAYYLHQCNSHSSLFNCSGANKAYGKYVDTGQVSKMLDQQKLDQQFLITTSALDAGVNIIDPTLTKIVICMKDIGTLLQCLGRKRVVDDKDKIDLYIQAPDNRVLAGHISKTKRTIEMAQYLVTHTTKELLEKYPKQSDQSNIIFDVIDPTDPNKTIKMVNELMLLKKKQDITTYRQMIGMGKYGFCRYLSEILGFYDEVTECEDYKIINECYGLDQYLADNEGLVMLDTKNRMKLIERIGVKRNGRYIKNINALNAVLSDGGYMHRIVQFRTSRTVNGRKKNYMCAWRIERCS